MNMEEFTDLERHNDDMSINRILCTPKVYKIIFDPSIKIGSFYLKTSNSNLEHNLRTISDYNKMLTYLEQNEDKFIEIFDLEEADEVIDLSSSVQAAINDDSISLIEKLM
ncbi:MAG: hypothetical protein P8Y16_08335 [Sulfurimonas sp.]